MVAQRCLRPAPVFDEPALRRAFEAAGVKEVHLGAVWQHVISSAGAGRPEDAPGLPGSAREVLQRHFAAVTSSVQEVKTSADGSTSKLLIRLQDGLQVEAVIMRYDASAGRYAGGPRPGGPRATLCVSSQVGCKMGCTFCATGTMGLLGDLAAGEIVEQLFHASQICPIRNVVFMGMGEPLNNYSAVVAAVRTLTAPRAFGLSPSHVTVSTVGVIPRMLTLPADLPGVRLALSLHAPTQALRATLVPAARAYPLDRLMAALDAYQAASGGGVLVEYVMLDGVNDREEDAAALGALLRGRDVFVNLIPYNPAAAADTYRPSSALSLGYFQHVLRDGHGLHATVRQEMGQDIAGACGQLAAQAAGPQRTPDIEDIASP
ncbi:radical SAM superfamily protein [Klebsormidium nitens]|uniref:Radical SAM superfamily protein n=1 Tax=Klebsormidium nitens TaxID=105231 RepID=A0A1Y1IK27_KLENI|nr:radical SAM superfamily protein [Klebsormidium nitens]|eukprot:GAQ91144.1 radical SAM superfamily protein [Klebsormidium nitens]